MSPAYRLLALLLVVTLAPLAAADGDDSAYHANMNAGQAHYTNGSWPAARENFVGARRNAAKRENADQYAEAQFWNTMTAFESGDVADAEKSVIDFWDFSDYPPVDAWNASSQRFKDWYLGYGNARFPEGWRRETMNQLEPVVEPEPVTIEPAPVTTPPPPPTRVDLTSGNRSRPSGGGWRSPDQALGIGYRYGFATTVDNVEDSAGGGDWSEIYGTWSQPAGDMRWGLFLAFTQLDIDGIRASSFSGGGDMTLDTVGFGVFTSVASPLSNDGQLAVDLLFDFGFDIGSGDWDNGFATREFSTFGYHLDAEVGIGWQPAEMILLRAAAGARLSLYGLSWDTNASGLEEESVLTLGPYVGIEANFLF